jgi:hypothetical protein
MIKVNCADKMRVVAEPHPRKRPIISIVPGGTDVCLCVISQHFVLGYFR